MVQKRKAKKSTKMRGSKTHGYGSMKKHRGAGHRAGRGNAGSGKRSDAKKPSLWKTHKSGKDPSKVGFNSWMRIEHVTINVGHLNSIADSLVREKKAIVTQGAVVINLREMGITKLLGSGKVTKKLKIAVQFAVPAAKEKLEAAGGSLDAEIVDKEQVKSDREARAEEFRKKNAKAPPQQAAPKKVEAE
jgi:large subunit ribosomal protein L15